MLSLASTFITVLQNICYDYSPVSQMFSIFLYGIIDWIFEKIPVRNVGGGSGRWEYVGNEGARSMRTCAYDGGRAGSNFCDFSAYILIEWPLSTV